ncbi:MAG: TetR/AcrR family transcriptional regulator [Solobacterium sp.]|nr:TetR/AcrR family transcriptional regulator [Solobacterium sp.]
MKTPRARKAIKEAYIDLLLTSDFESISLQDILHRSGYSKTSFYSYFTDKYDLAQKLLEDEAHALEEEVFRILQESKESEAPADYIVQRVFQHIKQEEKLYHIIVREIIPGYSLVRFSRYCNDIFKNRGEWNIKEHRFSINKELFAAIISGAFYGCVIYWDKNHFSLSVDYISSQFIMILNNFSEYPLIQ